MIVIADRAGELGNQLMVFANAIAWAIENESRVSYPGFAYGAWFEGTQSSRPWTKFPANPSRGVRLPSRVSYFSGRLAARLARIGIVPMKTISLPWMKTCEMESRAFRSLSDQYQLLFLEGWLFRAPHLLEKHRFDILEFFNPVSSIRVMSESLVAELRREVDVVVGVHIRQGDYNETFGRRYFLETGDYAVIMSRVMEYFAGLKVGFVICTNVAQDWTPFEKFVLAIGNGHPLGDLCSLQLSDVIIGPPSSFSLWAAFAGGRPLHWVTDMNQVLDLGRSGVPPLYSSSVATPLYWGHSLESARASTDPDVRGANWLKG